MSGTSQNKDKINDYEGFVEKFKPKKTTDDCYTPPSVFESVLDWVNENVQPLDGYHIARPFQPSGDYQKEAQTYDDKTIVIDNPPFSILAEIKHFYMDHGIKFFLFSPHLTLFSTCIPGISYIITKADIIYENGARVATDFITNMLSDDDFILTASSLKMQIERSQKKDKEEKNKVRPIYGYPSYLICSTTFDGGLGLGIDVKFKRSECAFIRQLNSQKTKGKSIYGYGFLVSEEAKKRAEEAKKRAEEAKKRAEEAKKNVWSLSAPELEIIKHLK